MCLRYKMMKFVFIAAIIACGLACPDERYCQFCMKDEKSSMCALCYQGFVDPKKGKCNSIPSADIVNNCLYYGLEPAEQNQRKVCVTCKLGFALKGNKCEECPVKGCAICDDTGYCEACANGKKLQIVDGKRVCQDAPNDIPNCDIAAYDFEGKINRCEICNKGYSVKEGLPFDSVCQKTSVENCMILQKGEAAGCAICSMGYYITSKGTCASNDSFSIWLWLLMAFIIVAIAVGIWLWVQKNNANHRHVPSEPLIN